MLHRLPNTYSAARRWMQENGSALSDAYNAYGNYARTDAFVKLFVRAWMVTVCAVIPITSVFAALTGNLTIFQFILAFGVGLVGALALIHVTQILERMFRPAIFTNLTPVMGSFISVVGVALFLDFMTSQSDTTFDSNRGRTASERATVLFHEALRSPISCDVVLRTEDFFDPISSIEFTPRCIAYVLDDSTTAAISETTLTQLYGPTAFHNNGKNAFTNLPLTRITKVRLFLSDDTTIASRVLPNFTTTTTSTTSTTNGSTPESTSEPTSEISVLTFRQGGTRRIALQAANPATSALSAPSVPSAQSGFLGSDVSTSSTAESSTAEFASNFTAIVAALTQEEGRAEREDNQARLFEDLARLCENAPSIDNDAILGMHARALQQRIRTS